MSASFFDCTLCCASQVEDTNMVALILKQTSGKRWAIRCACACSKVWKYKKIAISSFCSSGRLEGSHIAWIASQNLVASSAMLSAFRLRSAAYVPSIHLPINDLNQSIKQNTKTHDKETNSRNPMYFWDTIWFGIHVVVINISFYILHCCFQFCFCHLLHICRRPPR